MDYSLGFTVILKSYQFKNVGSKFNTLLFATVGILIIDMCTGSQGRIYYCPFLIDNSLTYAYISSFKKSI